MSLRKKLSDKEYNDPSFLSEVLRHGEETEAELRKCLEENERLMTQTQERLALLWHGVERGSFIRVISNNDVYCVTSIGGHNIAPNRQPILHGLKRRKDGTLGIREINIWHKWELVEDKKKEQA